MALTAQQREQRRAYCGSSDAAAILGLDPWRNAADVYLSKVSELEDRPTPAMELGNDLQPMLCAWAAQQVGATDYFPDIWRVSPAGLPIAVNLDGLILMPDTPNPTDETIIEAKATSMPGAWGEEDVEDDIPQSILVQIALQFHCCPKALMALVPRFAAEPYPGGGAAITRRLYKARRHDDLIEEVVDACASFMKNHVEARVPPTDCSPSLETMKRIVRVPASSVEVAGDEVIRDIRAWQELQGERLELKKTENRARAKVLTYFGTAEEMIAGAYRCRYMMEGTDHPVTYQYRARRVLRIKTQK